MVCDFFSGRIFNRDSLIYRYLSDSPSPTSDSQLVRKLYEILGKETASVLIGDFSFLIYDSDSKTHYAARDPLGVVPLYFGQNSRGEWFFSDRIDTVASRINSSRFNLTYIARILIEDYSDQQGTFLESVHALQSGHYLMLVDGRPEQIRYWVPDDRVLGYSTAEQYQEHFRDLFSEVLFSRSRGEKVGVFLSGGLDSSSLVCVMDQLDLNFEAFSLQFESDSQNDRKNLEMVQARIRAQSHTIAIDETFKGVEDNAKDGSLLYSPGLFYWRVLAQQMRGKGLQRAFTGLGGDDVFSQHVSYVSDLIKRLRFKEAIGELKLSLDPGDSFFKFFLQYGLFPNFPDKVFKTIKKLATPKGSLIVSDQFLKNNQILEKRNQEQLKIRDFFEEQRSRNLFWRLAQWGGYAFGLENQYRLAQLEDVCFEYPLMDQRMVEFAMKLPLEQLSFGGQDKVIIREAMRSFVPSGVCNTQSTQNYHLLSQKIFLSKREHYLKFLQKSKLVECGILEPSVLASFLDDLRNARCANVEQLAMILYFEKILAQEWNGRKQDERKESEQSKSRSKEKEVPTA